MIYPKGRCPAWKDGMRCRLEFAHIEDHEAHKDGITWTRDESDTSVPSLDFSVERFLDPEGDGRVTKDYSQ